MTQGSDEENRSYAETVPQGRSTVEAGLQLLCQLQQLHGFPVTVLILPTVNVPVNQYDSIEYHNQLREMADELPGITVIDLLEGFSS